MKLTDSVIKAAKPKDKPYKLSDGDGLVVLINPNSSKWWRYRYRYSGKEKMLSIGTYPEVTLKEARLLRVTASDILKQGIDPSQHRQEQKQQAALPLQIALNLLPVFGGIIGSTTKPNDMQITRSGAWKRIYFQSLVINL